MQSKRLSISYSRRLLWRAPTYFHAQITQLGFSHYFVLVEGVGGERELGAKTQGYLFRVEVLLR